MVEDIDLVIKGLGIKLIELVDCKGVIPYKGDWSALLDSRHMAYGKTPTEATARAAVKAIESLQQAQGAPTQS